MDVSLKLYNSTICRLCAEENINGNQIYLENGHNLSEIINKFLPFKVHDDGKLPCTLCPGCTIQLEATRLFFELIIDGQNKLKELLLIEESQDKLLHGIINPVACVETFDMQVDGGDEKILIQVHSDQPLFSAEQDMAINLLNRDTSRKKRGRPRKTVAEITEVNKSLEERASECKNASKHEETNIIVMEGLDKQRRRTKTPFKYSDTLQGKELERMLQEEGIDDDGGITLQLNVNHDSATFFSTESLNTHADNQIAGFEVGEASNSNEIKRRYDCDICGRTFIHQSRLEMHKAYHKDIFYQCTTCSQSFTSKDSFEEHSQSNKHEQFKLIEYVDDYGKIELPSSIEANVITIKNAPKPSATAEKFACEHCEKDFSSKQNLEVHQKAVHANEKPYTCDKCNKQFPYRTTFKKHMQQHSLEKEYPCEQCAKVFHHPSSLVYHRETEHNNGRVFVCNQCKKSFKHKQLLLRHQLVHTSDRPFRCLEENCSATFKTRANLSSHMSSHSKEKKFFCTECGAWFSYKTSFTLHQRWHKGQKPFECDVCLKTFSQKGNLAEHKRIHTGEKPFCCSYCGRRFTTSSQFKLHVKRHTGEKPWKCDYCGKKFLHKDTWRSHTRRHRNERPYQCTFCFRGFTEVWALKKHERLHTGEKPYNCDVCGKLFADSSNLKKHTKTHFKNQPPPETNQSIVVDQNAAAKKTSTEGLNKRAPLLYVTYQENLMDPNAMMQVVENLNENQDLLVAKDDPNQIGVNFSDDLLPGTSTEEISIDVQQLVDNDGNALSFTTNDGQLIKVVTTLDDQCIQGLMPDGTLIPINLSMQGGKALPDEAPAAKPFSLPESSALTTGELLPLVASDQKQKNQYLNEDGENLCFITTFDIDGGDSEFININ